MSRGSPVGLQLRFISDQPRLIYFFLQFVELVLGLERSSLSWLFLSYLLGPEHSIRTTFLQEFLLNSIERVDLLQRRGGPFDLAARRDHRLNRVKEGRGQGAHIELDLALDADVVVREALVDGQFLR
jgi:hypothetical protein